MTDHETLLQDAHEGLNEIVKPYQVEINRQQRMANFIKNCMRCAARNDFLQLDELLKTKLARDILEETGIEESGPIFKGLREYANEQVDRYRMEFIEDLTEKAREADLEITIDFPRFQSLKGIDGEIDFSNRTTTINKKLLKSIDPRRIVTALLRVKKQLYDRPYDPRTFIDGLYGIYNNILKQEKLPPGAKVTAQHLYLDYVVSLQSKPFFQDMDKGRFRGYSGDQFNVDLWRYLQAGIEGTSDGRILRMTPGRISALWLIDNDGEKRRITSISFEEKED